MNFTAFLDFLENIALFTLLSLFIVILLGKLSLKPLLKNILFGLYFSAISIFAMFSATELSEGIIFDSRFLLAAFSGYIGGPLSGLITIVITSIVRLNIGGIGAIAGCIGIVSSGLLGILYYLYIKTKIKNKNLLYFALFGLLISIATLLIFLLIPISLEKKAYIFTELIYIIPLATIVASCVIGITIEHEAKLNLLLTTIKTEKQQSDYLAFHDKLTSIANRAAIMSTTNNLIKKKKSFYMALLDLDNFKMINDTHGHNIGDEILVAFADRIKVYLEPYNSFCGRLGGDEFIILLIGYNKSECENIFKSLKDNLDEPFILSTMTTRINASIGISHFPNDTQILMELLKYSDIVLYESKKNYGTNFMFYENPMFLKFERKLLIENSLRSSNIEKEFFVVLQPIVYIDSNISHGYKVGFEILLRWNSPILGTISPYEFIPIAESIGYISNLGKFVINQSFDALSKLIKTHNKEYFISINTSSYELSNVSYVDFFIKTLEQYDISCSSIVIEITERVILKMNDIILKNIKSLKEKGVKLALDDFGTGLSSIQSLKHLPFDYVKIDKEFIQISTSNNNDNDLIHVIIDLLNIFNVDIIAEGVESKDEYNQILSNNIKLVQGYYTGRPADLDFLLSSHQDDN